MRRTYATVVLAVLLAFGLSFAISMEDLPETSYDESEPAPYEATPQISTFMLMQSARFASDEGRLVLPIRPPATLPAYSGQSSRIVPLRFAVVASLAAQVIPLRC
jgi:hypothetical protein